MGGLSGCICICYVNTCYGFLEFSGVFFGPAEFMLMLSF